MRDLDDPVTVMGSFDAYAIGTMGLSYDSKPFLRRCVKAENLSQETCRFEIDQ